MTKKPETLDGEWLPANPTPSKSRGKVSIGLKKIEDVRMEMSRVYRDCRSGAIDASVGARLTFILVSIGRLIETTDMEQRIEQLENANEITSKKPHRES